MLHSCSHVQMHVWIIMQHSSTPTEIHRCRVLARYLAIVSRVSPSHTREGLGILVYSCCVLGMQGLYRIFGLGGGTPHLGVT